jgi:hypothetical protein
MGDASETLSGSQSARPKEMILQGLIESTSDVVGAKIIVEGDIASEVDVRDPERFTVQAALLGQPLG